MEDVEARGRVERFRGCSLRGCATCRPGASTRLCTWHRVPEKAVERAKQGHGDDPIAAIPHHKVYVTLLNNADTIEKLRREHHHCKKIFEFLVEKGVLTDKPDRRDGSGRAYTAARKLFGRKKLKHVK